MNGIQFYLEDGSAAGRRSCDLPRLELGADFDLAAAVLARLDLSQYGNGRVGGILSVDISNWTAPGNFNGKPAMAVRDARRDQGRGVGAAEGGAERAGRAGSRTTTSSTGSSIRTSSCPIRAGHQSEPLLINHAGSLTLRPRPTPRSATSFSPPITCARTPIWRRWKRRTRRRGGRPTRSSRSPASTTAPCGLWAFDIPKPMRDAQESSIGFGSGWACQI